MFRCFRYLKVLSRSIYIYISVFRQLDIQAGELFPWISMHHRRRPRSAGPTSGATGADRAVENGAQMECTGGAGIFGLCRRDARPPGRFGGCTSKDVVEQKQKRGARCRRLQYDEGPHHNVVPLSNGEKRPRLPENNNVIFHGANKKLESGCTDIEPQEIP